MSLLGELATYARFLRGLPAFLHARTTLAQARTAIAQRLASREEDFLRFVERGLLAAPRSPYPALLRRAGCESGDVRKLVRDRGIEGALCALREAGVYFSYEEFKGRTPVVRNGRELPLRPSDFDNPFLSHWFSGTTSGSTGAATRITTDLDHLAIQAEHRLVTLEAHGLTGLPWAIWRPPLPAGSGINNVLRGVRGDSPPARWFTPLSRDDLRSHRKYALATDVTVALGRLLGARLPWPVRVPLDRADEIARWLAEARDRRGGAWLNTTVSGGLRIGRAARGAGIDLTGVTLMLAGEPATPAKIRGVRASGARCFTDYGMAEAGRLAMGCAGAREESDVHLLSDIYAVIPWPRAVAYTAEPITSFHVTAFHPSSPKLLLNVEFDDFGAVDETPCGCPLEALGYRTHLRGIRSYGKLTGEGVTLAGADVVRILEEVLPARFGGSPLDYQIAEEEDEDGLTRLTLVVSPRVGEVDHGALGEAMLQALAETSVAATVARAFWQQAGTLRVRRAEPYTNARGKQPLLHRRPTAGVS